MANILVVDDDPDVRRLFVNILESLGHTAKAAQDGQEALEALALELPDLITLRPDDAPHERS